MAVFKITLGVYFRIQIICRYAPHRFLGTGRLSSNDNEGDLTELHSGPKVPEA